MLPRLAAVVEDGPVRASGVLKGIGEDRHPVEGSVIVDGLCDLDHRSSVPRQPGGLKARPP